MSRHHGGWVPLSEFLAANLPSRSAPLRVGEPIGAYRLENLLGRLRQQGRVELRGRPGVAHAEHVAIPPGEWSGYVVAKGRDRLRHVRTRVTYYSCEARLVRAGALAGRSRGRNYKALDESLVDEAIALIQSGKARGRVDAARQLAPRAVGSGTEESRVKRILRRLATRFGSSG